MSRPDRSVAADVYDLERIYLHSRSDDRRYQIEEWLRQRYRDVHSEGFEDGKLAAMTAGRNHFPYGR